MLTSRLFSDSPQLATAAVDDRAHVVPGAVGRHVGKIQAALEILDDADIPLDEWIAMRNGAGTTAAILGYKEKRKIINPAYQTRADNIVGKMTVARMDKELLEAERTAGFGQRAGRRCPQCVPEPILSRTNAVDDQLRAEARSSVRGFAGGSSAVTGGSGGAALVTGGSAATIQAADPFSAARGFSTADNYQMIPVGGFRDFKIQTFDSAVILSSTMGQTGRCELVSSKNFVRTTEDPNLPLPISIPRNVEAVIRIHANSERRTIIGLFTGNSAPISQITLSFKRLRAITLKNVVLSDALRTAKRTKASIPALLAKVVTYYRNMCNLIIFADTTVGDIKVDADLGDVIDVDNSKNIARILVEMKAAAPGVNLVVVFSWNIESNSNPDKVLFGKDILGVGTPFIIVEDSDSPGFDAARESNILAHEIGHGLNLPHELNELGNLMSDSIASFGTEMISAQIDIVNPSGKKP